MPKKARHSEGESLLRLFDFDATITVWEGQANVMIQLHNRQTLYEDSLDLTEEEKKELNQLET